jgi:hypothetical protein
MILRGSITRPSNVTAYAAGDVINGNALTIPIKLDAPGVKEKPSILSCVISSDNPASTPAIDAYFYSSAITVALDNAAFAPSHADNSGSLLGKIVHTAWDAFTASKVSFAKPDAPIGLEKYAPTAEKDIHVVLVARGAYTPVSGENITVTINLG